MRKLISPMALMALLAALVGTLAGTLIAAPSFAKDLPDPLGLRGINLGMTLAEVRKLGHPDKPAGKIELVCTGDELGAELDFDLEPFGKPHVAAGMKVCSFQVLGKYRIRDAAMDVAGHDAIVRFFFTPKSDTPATSERLFNISVSSNTANFHEMFLALLRKYGEAKTDRKVSGGKTRRDVRMLEWGNDRNGIFMIEVSDTGPGDTLEIAYSDFTLLKLVEGLAEKAKKTGADKL